MSRLHTIALTLVLPMIASGLVACTEDETLDDAQLRAVNVKDSWGLHGTTHFPDVNSCTDYYNDLCAGLSSTMCTIASNRYKCTQASQGVWVTDTYGTVVAAQAVRTWEGVSVGDESGSGELGSPSEACGSMLGISEARCVELAGLAEHVNHHLDELHAVFPEGGLAQLVIIEDHLLLTPYEVPGEDLVWQTADALDWTVAMLAGEYELPSPGYVFEDNVILAIRPNGTMSLSTAEAAFTQSVVAGEQLALGSLRSGECLELGEAVTTATTDTWTLGEGVAQSIIIEDHLLLTSVFEDNVILRISGPASTSDDTLTVAAATLMLNSPDIDDPCDGFCDGICVDGECYMNLPPYSLGLAGICAN